MGQESGVIFDMDGVLVDSYHAHYQSWLVITEPEGLSYSEAQFAATFGRTSREVIATLWGQDRFAAEKIAELDHAKEEAFRRIIAADFPTMPGVIELIHSLHDAGFQLAVGSSAPPANVDLVLDRLGCRALFAAVVNGSEVVRGKPDPQVFLLAAQRLGIPPIQCAVIEDAPAGIAAAHSAGMTSVGLASTGRTFNDLAAAHLTVASLAELSPERIREAISVTNSPG